MYYKELVNAKDNKGLLIGSIFTLVMTIIFVVIAFAMNSHSENRKANCTESIPATIVDIKQEKYRDSDGYRQNIYYNVYQYTYNGLMYTNKSETNKQDQYNVGDTVIIKVNPDKPSEFIDSTTTGTLNILFIAFLIGSGVTLIMSIIFFFSYKGKIHIKVG